MLDGAWGPLIHGAGLRPRTTAASASRPPARRRGRPRRAQPDAAGPRPRRCTSATSPRAPTSRRRTRSRRRRSARPTTGSRTRSTSMNVAGARIAREAAGADRFVAGSVGPLNVTLSLSPRVDDPGFRTHTFDQVKEALRRADPRARRRRRRPAADRDDLRHAEREGGDRRRARGGAASCRSGSASRSSTSPGARSAGRRSRPSGRRSSTPSR